MSTEVFGLGFDCVPSFSSGEVVSKRARGFSQGRANASRRVTLTGSLPVCMLFRKTKAKLPVRTIRFAKKLVTTNTDS
jgi:hypothetical protein